MISLNDLFMLGLGLDLVGAFLLLKGLLMDPRTIVRTSGAAIEFHPHSVMARIEDRVRAEFGLLALVSGFVFQIFGYLFATMGVEVATGNAEAGFAVVMVVLAGMAMFLLYRLFEERYVKRYAIEGASPEGSEAPDIERLARMGKVRWPDEPGESDEDYVGRVFGRGRRGPRA